MLLVEAAEGTEAAPRRTGPHGAAGAAAGTHLHEQSSERQIPSFHMAKAARKQENLLLLLETVD